MPDRVGLRTDIQVLRAVAVLAVVAHHVWAWPSGGFVGVDVFFVISGFLITSKLLEPSDRPARQRVARFYVRRARRILPAALVTIAATTMVGHVLFSAERAARLTTDAGWATLFAANWHFAAQQTDYFDSSLPASPLQHYWSLAVEEQFYLVWPLLLLLGLAAGRAGRSSQPRIVLWIGLLVLADLVWSWHLTGADPTGAYFSTAARAWEIGAGALVAAVAGSCARIPERVRRAAVLTGAAGVGASLVLVDAETRFPGAGALLPVLATCLVLAAGTRGLPARAEPRTPLVAGPVRGLVAGLVHVGTISFSLYLWHWPVLVFLGATPLEGGPLLVPAALLLTLLLGEASYRFVERPWLSPVAREQRRWGLRWAAPTAAAAMVLATTGLALASTSPQGRPVGGPETSRATAPPPVPLDAPTDLETLTARWAERLRTSLEAAEFPALNPPLGRPGDGVPPELDDASGCLDPVDPTDTSLCTFVPPRPTGRLVVILGDSVALSWLPGIRAALAPEGYTVHAVTFSSCPPALVEVTMDSTTWEESCTSGLRAALDQVDRLRPDLVVGSAFQETFGRVVPRSPTLSAQATYLEGLVEVGDRVRRAGARFVLLGPAPSGPSPLDCGGRLQRPSDCVTSAQGSFQATVATFGAAAARGGFESVDTEPWFCVSLRCPIFVDDRLVRWDDSHLTDQLSRHLAPLLRAALLPQA